MDGARVQRSDLRDILHGEREAARVPELLTTALDAGKLGETRAVEAGSSSATGRSSRFGRVAEKEEVSSRQCSLPACKLSISLSIDSQEEYERTLRRSLDNIRNGVHLSTRPQTPQKGQACISTSSERERATRCAHPGEEEREKAVWQSKSDGGGEDETGPGDRRRWRTERTRGIHP